MEIKVQKWQVGAFIFAGLVMFIVSLFLLGGDRFLAKYNKYWIEFEQVQGLNPGSVVSLAGINVGNVEQILLNPDNHHIQVQIRVEKSMAVQITEGSKADLRTQGALGDKYIYIVPGSPSSAAIPVGQFIPVLASKDILSVISERGAEAEKIFDILGNVKDVTQELKDKRRVEIIMQNMAAASENFKVASENLAKVTSNPKLNSSIDRLDTILMKIEKGQGSLGAFINDRSIHDQLKGMLGGSKSKDGMRNVLRNTIQEH